MNFPELNIKKMHKTLVRNGRQLESELAAIDHQLDHLESMYLQETYLDYNMRPNYEQHIAAFGESGSVDGDKKDVGTEKQAGKGKQLKKKDRKFSTPSSKFVSNYLNHRTPDVKKPGDDSMAK